MFACQKRMEHIIPLVHSLTICAAYGQANHYLIIILETHDI